MQYAADADRARVYRNLIHLRGKVEWEGIQADCQSAVTNGLVTRLEAAVDRVVVVAQ